MGAIHVLIFYSYMLSLSSQNIPIAYTLAPTQSIIDGQTLTSQGGAFELGFFSPPDSNNHYLGIWYKPIPVQTVVWVANRDSPLNDTSGVLKISSTGHLVITVNQTERVIWSSNSSKVVDNPIVEFLESGNLVLRDVNNGDSNSYSWQSFDYLSDTLLPGMKHGRDFKTGMNRFMSSWKSVNDPSQGDFTYGYGNELTGFPEPAILNMSNTYYRSGPWNGLRYSGSPDLKPNPIFRYEVVENAEEIYYMYQLVDKSVISRLVLTQTGVNGYLQRYTWVEQSNSWVLHVNIPRDRCDAYALCGAYGSCDMLNVPVCQCLKGFKPKSPKDWNEMDWSQGCERETPINCTKGEGFLKFTGVKLPDTTGSWLNMSMNLEECKVKCLNNCSCMAYTNSNITGGGSGCVMWFTDLSDIRQLNDAGQDLYIRMDASELDSEGMPRNMEHVIVIACIASVAGMILLGLGGWCIWKKRNRKGDSVRDDLKMPLFDMITITTSTNNFSEANKLGEGGYGPVYKGKLEGELEIAVKRLSKNSTQGDDEFMNEVLLISKLQHRNLVRLLGCCIEGEEKILVYEYMQNKSLDSFIFDKTKGRLLDWQRRFHIILGIARGLLYLHHDSRLRIIHRDLKASNILLDSEMVPKISDFGMARIFGGDQTEAKTKRVVGTYGYMSPEYAVDGHFSVKSDVFSFGVLVLEIISGKKNRGFCHPDHELNLLGHAWRLWNEDQSKDLIDDSITSSFFVEDVLRCIHIGLLCVQKSTEQRPTMSSVVLMLSSETAVLPKPQQPGFYVERSPNKSNSSTSDKAPYISNDFTISLVEGR